MKLTRLIILSQENISTKIVKFNVSFVYPFEIIGIFISWFCITKKDKTDHFKSKYFGAKYDYTRYIEDGFVFNRY